MAEKIVIAELDISASSVIKKISELNAEILELKIQQKVLKDSTNDTGEAFALNEVKIKALNKELNANQAIAVQLINTNKAQAKATEDLNTALSKEATTVAEARKQNKELKLIRDNTTTTTIAGAKAISDLNKKINDNDSYIEKNSSSLEKLKFRVGDYTNGIINALQQTTGLGAGLQNLTSIATGVGGAFTAVIAAIGFTAKKSADYEEALLGVRQASGITADESNRLLDSLKLINTRTNIEGLIELSNIGAQIGETSAKGLSDFAEAADKVSVGLGKRLGPNTEEVLTQLAKLAVITGDSQKFGLSNSIERIGSSIAVLADIGTATGPKIGEFAEKFGGIASQLNISTPIVLGFGAAVEELGQEPAVAATQIQDLFLKIGANVPKYAKIAGIEVSKFSDILKTKPEEAFISVLRGLKSYGGGVEEITKKLTEAGIKEDRAIRVLGALSSNIDLVTSSLDASKKAYEENIKTQKNADIANETTTASFKKLYNNIIQVFSNSGLNNFIKTTVSGLNSLIVKLEEFSSKRGKDDEYYRRAADNLKKLNKDITAESLNFEVKRLKLIDQLDESNKKSLDSRKAALKKEQEINLAKADIAERAQKEALKASKEDIDIEIDKLQATKNINDLSFKEQKAYYNKLYNLKVQAINLDDKLSDKQKSGKKDVAKVELNSNLSNVSKNQAKEDLKNKKEASENAIKIAKNELDAYLLSNKSRLDNNKFISDEVYKQELDRIERSRQAEETFLQNKLINDVKFADEYASAIAEVNAKYDAQKLDLQKQQDDANKERLAANAQLEFDLKQLQYETEYEQQQAQLDRQYQEEIKAANKNGADKTLIAQKYFKLQENLEKERIKNTLSAYSQLFSGITALVGENTVLGKAAAIADATIQTYLAATNAYAAAAKIDPIFLAPTMAGLAIAAGFANIAKIEAVEPPKAARGMLLNGNSHAQGGIKIEAEGGEAIINKRSTAMFLPQLSAINEAGGGVKFASGGITPSYNSIGSNNIIKSVDTSYIMMQRLVDNINQTKVVAVVDDINIGQYQRAQVLDRARL